MTSPAHVGSIAAIDDFRAALCTFGQDAKQALSMVDMEVRRAMEWLTNQQPLFWQNEVRRGGENVNHAKEELQRCKTFKAMKDYTPACTEEKKPWPRPRKNCITPR